MKKDKGVHEQNNYLKKGWDVIKKIFICLFIFQLVYIIICKWINPPITITQLSSIFHGYGLQKSSIDFNKMGYNIKLAVIASEDQLFVTDNGFNVKAIEKAIIYNKEHPNKRRGGSTISQQVAKNVFLWQEGGYIRKAMEAYFTFMIEKIWHKKRILQVYLNVAEMGKGVFGVQEAAQKYFRKDASNLTRAEAANIAACLTNPKVYTIRPLSKYVANRSVDILYQMNLIENSPDIQNLIK